MLHLLYSLSKILVTPTDFQKIKLGFFSSLKLHFHLFIYITIDILLLFNITTHIPSLSIGSIFDVLVIHIQLLLYLFIQIITLSVYSLTSKSGFLIDLLIWIPKKSRLFLQLLQYSSIRLLDWFQFFFSDFIAYIFQHLFLDELQRILLLQLFFYDIHHNC